MAQQKVELRRTRDFSQNLNDTFQFIRENFKPLISSFFLIAGIFMLANSIVSGLYQSRMSYLFTQIFSGRGGSFPVYNAFNSNYLLVGLFGWLNITAMQVAIISYIRAYELRDGQTPEMGEVWDVFKKNYIKVLFYNIPVFLLTLIGFLFCLFPGVYFAVVLAPFAIIVVLENKSFSDAFSRCFEIIRNNFWNSLGIYFLVYLIYSFSSGIISVIVGGISGVLSYLTTRDIGTTIGIITSVLSIFSFVFYIIYYVSVSLHYYNLVEKTDGTGILKRLDKLGDRNDFNNIQEDY